VSWNRAAAAQAIAAKLGTVTLTDGVVTVFATPPLTLNPPAYVVALPTDVARNLERFGVDVATIPVGCFGGLGEYDRVDELANLAAAALEADASLGGAVIRCTVPHLITWRTVTIGGSELLAQDLQLVIDM